VASRADAAVSRQGDRLRACAARGPRRRVSLTSSLLKAAPDCAPDAGPTKTHLMLGVLVPEHSPKTPARSLDPRATWAHSAGVTGCMVSAAA